MPPIDLSGQIPTQYSTQIITEATQQSAALALGSRIPMGTKVTDMPVPKAFPRAAFVNTPGGRKPFTDLKLSNEQLTAEEIAAVVSIPDEYLDDSGIDLWGYARPLLAEAIALAFDDAVFWGVGAPPTYPTGGLASFAIDVAPGDGDAISTVNEAMSAVEAEGLAVTGHAADVAVQGALRGVRDATGAFLLGASQTQSGSINTLYGLPIAYSQFSTEATGDFITGAWRYLMIGVRQDIRFQFSTDGVLADDTGKVVVSGFQDNQTLLKVWARFGCVVVEPVTRRAEDGAKPFAIATIADAAPFQGNFGKTGPEGPQGPPGPTGPQGPPGA